VPVTVSLLSVPSTLAHPLPPSNTRAHFFAGVVVRPSLGVENSTLESGSRSAPCCPLQGPLRALAAHARDALVEIVKVAALQLAGELCTARGVLGLAIFEARSTNSCTVAGCDKLTMAASWAQSVFLRSWSFGVLMGKKTPKNTRPGLAHAALALVFCARGNGGKVCKFIKLTIPASSRTLIASIEHACSIAAARGSARCSFVAVKAAM